MEPLPRVFFYVLQYFEADVLKNHLRLRESKGGRRENKRFRATKRTTACIIHDRNNATITMRTISEMIEEPDALDVPGITVATRNNKDINNSREMGDNDHRAVIF